MAAGFVLASAPGPLAAGNRAVIDAARFPQTAALPGAFTEQAKLTPIGDARGDLNDSFGSAVAVDGDTVVVGAPWHDLPDRDTGAAYVFVRASGVWRLQATLSPSGSPTEGFGISVAISGDTVVVGAQDFWSSAVYVFVRSSGFWTQEARLVGTDTRSFDGFGMAVSVSGDTLVVGAPDATTVGNWSGAAYVFERSGGVWTERQKLFPYDLTASDRFGQSVAVWGDSIVAGSPGDDAGLGLYAGSAYVFVRSGAFWAQESKLTSSGAAAGNDFGSSVSMYLDAVAVGAPGEGAGSYPDGAVYVFRHAAGVWSEEQRLVAEAPFSSREFGAAVALDIDTLVIGAPGELLEDSTGAAHVFRRDGGVWTEEQRLTHAVPGTYAAFGGSVAVANDVILVADPIRDAWSGSAFAFRRVASTWVEEARLDAPGTASLDHFGSSIALEGDVLVVGAPDDDVPAGRAAGSVSVFVRAGPSWTLQQRIVAPDAQDGDHFGAAVALSGETLAVGATGVRGAIFEAGAVYLFVRAGGVWQPQQRVVYPADGSFTGFGSAVSLDGGSLIAGAPGEGVGSTFEAGAAYVFVRTGASWSLEQRLAPSTPVMDAHSGFAVALEGDTAIVGARQGPASGKVSVFRRTGGVWAQEVALLASDGADRDGFGRALALSGNTLVIGAPSADIQGIDGAGAAYVFVRSGSLWSEQRKLVAADPDSFDRFGTAVATSGDRVLASAPQDLEEGFVLLFERSGGLWIERQRIAASDGYRDDRFGTAAALSGATVAVGAPSATTPTGFASGAVYVLVPATADLALSITGSPGRVAQGELVIYTIVVRNNGPDAASFVRVDNSLEVGLVVESVSASQGECTHTPSSITCALGLVTANTSATVSVVAAAVHYGVFTSQASLLWTGSDPVPGNDMASVSTIVDSGGRADLTVTKSGPSLPAAVGSTLSYRIQVANLGPSMAAGVEVRDPTPPGLTLLGTFGACTNGFPCSIPRMRAGESRTIYVTLAVPPSYQGPDPVVNTASVTTATPDPIASNDSSTVEAPFFVPAGNVGFHTLPPCRLLDTRHPAPGGPGVFTASKVAVLFPALGPCGVPSGARALAVNVTVTQPSAPGDLRLYPAGMPVPLVSSINYGTGQTRGNNAVVSLSSYGALAVKVGQVSGTVHVILDVFGYFE